MGCAGDAWSEKGEWDGNFPYHDQVLAASDAGVCDRDDDVAGDG